MALPNDYINAYLAPCAGYGWAGGPGFMTQIVELQNGREKRNAMWRQPRHKFTAPFLNISQEAFRSLKDMFLICRGQAFAFRFRDENDYEADQAQFAVSDGVQDTYQLSKLILIANQTFVREVYALPSRPVITINGVPNNDWTVDLDRGTIKFTVIPPNGAVLRWTGDFDVWVRFANDELNFSLDNPNRTNGSIDLIEVPAPPIV